MGKQKRKRKIDKKKENRKKRKIEKKIAIIPCILPVC